MRLPILCLSLMLGSLPAVAQTPPTFDVVGWCQDNVAAGAFQEDGIAGCVATEQRKFRSLWALYRASTAESRGYCEIFARSATAGRGSYAVLNFCLHEEMQKRR